MYPRGTCSLTRFFFVFVIFFYLFLFLSFLLTFKLQQMYRFLASELYSNASSHLYKKENREDPSIHLSVYPFIFLSVHLLAMSIQNWHRVHVYVCVCIFVYVFLFEHLLSPTVGPSVGPSIGQGENQQKSWKKLNFCSFFHFSPSCRLCSFLWHNFSSSSRFSTWS